MTLSDWVSRWIDLRAPSLAPRTVECYRSLLVLHIVPSLGCIELAALNDSVISGFLAALVSDGHSRTAQLCFVLLRAALKAALLSNIVTRNPMDQLSPPRHRRADPRWWSPEELRRFATATNESSWSLAWQLALCCGLRRGELAGLRWTDVDLAAGLIRVRNQRQRVGGQLIDAPPKSASGRRDLPIPPGLLPMLEAQQLYQQAEALLTGCAPVYVCSPDGQPIPPEALNRALAADIARAGVRPINLHGLRHSMASLAVSLGVPMRVLQQLLGHSSYTVTANTYAHVLHADQTAAIDKISRHVL